MSGIISFPYTVGPSGVTSQPQGNIQFTVEIPKCNVCGKEKSIDWDDGSYVCFACEGETSNDVEPLAKVKCDCDIIALMTHGCKIPNHY